LLQYIYGLPNLAELRGDPSNVLAAIDDYASSVTGLINVGSEKGNIVTALIGEKKPQVMVELGSYIGYSAIKFGSALKNAGGKRYYSVEKDPLFAAITASLVDLAGLRDTVRVVVGTGAEGIQLLVDEGPLSRKTKLDMLFLDHHKPSYTADLQLCERLGLVEPGTVLVADNMIVPGNPPYTEWVRASVDEKKAKARASPSPDSIGNPNLQYKSQFVKGVEPWGIEDAMEITECVGVAA
jgi:catechol O-methyltransferase